MRGKAKVLKENMSIRGIVAAILDFGVEYTKKYHTRSKACFESRCS